MSVRSRSSRASDASRAPPSPHGPLRDTRTRACNERALLIPFMPELAQVKHVATNTRRTIAHSTCFFCIWKRWFRLSLSIHSQCAFTVNLIICETSLPLAGILQIAGIAKISIAAKVQERVTDEMTKRHSGKKNARI